MNTKPGRAVRLLLLGALLAGLVAGCVVPAPDARTSTVSSVASSETASTSQPDHAGSVAQTMPPRFPAPPHPRPPRPLPPPPMPPAPPLNRDAVTIEQHAVNATIDGPVATVHVTQLFRNDSGQVAEGVYLFPLPLDAAIGDVQMTVDGQVLEGRVLTREEARRIYEEIVRQQRDPALLEYVGRDLFQASVFPIPPGAQRTVELTYNQVLNLEDGLYRFNYPLDVRQHSARPPESVALSVQLQNQPGLRTLYSPSHAVTLTRTGDDGATVRYAAVGPAEAADAVAGGDFDLYFGVDESAIGLNLLSYKPAGEEGFFVLLAAPSLQAAGDAVIARDVVLVVDVSGSMQGEKMEQARQAAHYLVDQLNPDDRFDLIAFSSGVHLWEGELQPVDEATTAAAHGWIDGLAASGSTDINRALLEALALLAPDEARPAYILFMTDGLPTQGETEPPQILRNAVNNAPADRTIRFFTFGVGYDVNTDLLDALSKRLGGRSSYVQPQERIDEAVSSFYSRISAPVLANVDVSFSPDVLMSDVYPYPLPDLFAGEQLVAAGRYRNGGPVQVTLTGDINGQEAVYEYPERELATRGGSPFVARLWAARKIGELVEQVRVHGPSQELVDEIVDLSLAYGIITPFTSFLVEEPGMAQGPERPVTGSEQPPTVMPMPRSVQPQAEAAASEGLAAMAAAPASGESAVAAAEERGKLQTTERVEETRELRYVEGKTFVRQGSVTYEDGSSAPLWVDSQYDEAMPVATVAFASDRYFDLASDPTVAHWLALSSELVIVLEDGQAVRITQLAGQE